MRPLPVEDGLHGVGGNEVHSDLPTYNSTALHVELSLHLNADSVLEEQGGAGRDARSNTERDVDVAINTKDAWPDGGSDRVAPIQRATDVLDAVSGVTERVSTIRDEE